MNGWTWWLGTTGVDAALVGCAMLILGRTARLTPRWMALLLTLALLRFMMPPVAPARAATEWLRVDGLELSALAGSPPWLWWLAAAQVLGLAVALFLIVRTNRILRLQRAESDPVDAGAAAGELRVLARQMGVATPAVYVTDDFGPAAAGLISPAIFLPRSLVEALDPDELRMILAHELAHIARRDVVAGLLRTVVLGLWWFHPVAWVLARRHRASVEEACDEAVLRLHFCDAGRYAGTLVESARLSAVGPGVLALTRHPMEQRLLRLLHPPRDAAGTFLSALVVLFAVALLPMGLTQLHSDSDARDRDVRAETVIRRIVK